MKDLVAFVAAVLVLFAMVLGVIAYGILTHGRMLDAYYAEHGRYPGKWQEIHERRKTYCE